MSDSELSSVYLVDASSDPVVVRIVGRANFQNSGCLREFMNEMLTRGRRRFAIDFRDCAGMDSTFLGVLAGVAIGLRKVPDGGSLIALRVAARNLELMRNLGLHRLLTIDPGAGVDLPVCRQALDVRVGTELESARMVLEAHENLVVADEANRAKFQDVLAFLRDRVREG